METENKNMKNKKKKIEPSISKHFSEMGKRSWAVRKEKLLKVGELSTKK